MNDTVDCRGDGSRLLKYKSPLLSPSHLLLYPLSLFPSCLPSVRDKDTIMEKRTLDHTSDASDRSPSDEKIGVEEGAFETLGRSELPPDPDAHLSEAEKAAVVSSIRLPPQQTQMIRR